MKTNKINSISIDDLKEQARLVNENAEALRDYIRHQELLVRKVNYIISDWQFGRSTQKLQGINHFVALRKRLLEGKKLTKKMQENLEWIDKTVILDGYTFKKNELENHELTEHCNKFLNALSKGNKK